MSGASDPTCSALWICGAGGGHGGHGHRCALVVGLGRCCRLRHALLYPNLSAAVADITPPAWRGSAIGIYRFWRDLGYAIGALGLGLAASLTGAAEAAFWFVAISMFASGAVLCWLGEETHRG